LRAAPLAIVVVLGLTVSLGAQRGQETTPRRIVHLSLGGRVRVAAVQTEGRTVEGVDDGVGNAGRVEAART